MTIRRATRNDRQIIRELWEEFEAELGGPSYLLETWDEAWTDLSQTVKSGLALLAEDDGTPVGFLFCILGDRGRKTAHITDFYVRPDVRNKGVGRELLAEVVGPAREAGLDHVSLEVLIENASARRLYERLGFASVDLFMVATLRSLTERLGSDEHPPSFGSLHVQTDDEEGVERAVNQFLPRLGRSARTEVSQAQNGWVTVIDELCDRDRSAQRRLGTEISERLGVPAVALALEEEAVVRFLLFERGRMVDEYLSVPTYYGPLSKADELSLSANPTLAARLTGADPVRVRAVARVASSPSELPPPRELLEEIAEVLGLDARIDR